MCDFGSLQVADRLRTGDSRHIECLSRLWTGVKTAQGAPLILIPVYLKGFDSPTRGTIRGLICCGEIPGFSGPVGAREGG